MESAIIEMPKGTHYKYEICKKSGRLILDRPIDIAVPYNYGYISCTLCEDGDPLDVFVITTEPIPSLTEVKVVPFALIRCKDNGVRDDKLLAYIENDKRTKKNLEVKGFDKDYIISDVCYYLENYKKGIEIEEIVESKRYINKVLKEAIALKEKMDLYANCDLNRR